MSDEEPRPRDTFARYRDQLAAVGFRPSTSRGQNFLLDPTLHRWIADQADAGDADTVVEIGVGLGFLTRELAARAGKVLAIEIEPRLLEIARRDLIAATPVEWVEGDALGGPGRTLLPCIAEAGAACRGRFLVVANLPYSVSGPMLAELAQLPRLPDRIIVLVQKELAQRLAAPPGTEAYGGLSALLQCTFRAKLLRDVPPDVFRPRPKVTSSVVALERLATVPAMLEPAAGRRQLALFLRQLFAQRRKTLRTTIAAAVRGLGWTLPELPVEVTSRRAEQLSLAELLELFRLCHPESAS